MDSSEGRPARSRRVSRLLWRPGVVTALLTVALAGLFAFAAERGEVIVRVPRDNVWLYYPASVAGIWRALLDRLPPEAPGLLERGPLAILLALAGLAFAYAIVATLRLPRSS